MKSQNEPSPLKEPLLFSTVGTILKRSLKSLKTASPEEYKAITAMAGEGANQCFKSIRSLSAGLVHADPLELSDYISDIAGELCCLAEVGQELLDIELERAAAT